MRIFLGFLPILLFVFIYVGSGIFFSVQEVANAFYQISPTVAIIPAIILGWILHRGSQQERMQSFLDGARHRDIMTMCIIFLLAGAFGGVTKAIGSVDATVNLALTLIPHQLLLIGLFLIAAFISTSIGTSMGTIAAIAPIAAGIATQSEIPLALGMATIVGGAMFGDSLSVISDTTIAAVMSQEADMRKKLYLNAIVAVIAAVFTIVILFCVHEASAPVKQGSYALILIAPYILLMVLAVSGLNVFVVLISALTAAGILGGWHHGYTLVSLSHDISHGFNSMYEIMLLSLMVGGLSGLAGSSAKELAVRLAEWSANAGGGQRMAQFLIGKIVSVFDILLANNTVAIIFSGEMARHIAKRYRLPAHYSAAWLDVFSCVFQGIIPYGAQILLASTIGGISPLSIVPHVYFCYILGVVTIIFIMVHKPRQHKHLGERTDHS